MKLLVLLFACMSLVGPNSNIEHDKIFRETSIKEIIRIESEIAEARCFCRIGNDRGSQVESYPNAFHDLGTLFTYTGIRPMSQQNQDNCSRRCSEQASRWANSLSDDQLCNYFKKNGSNTLRAYSKVGTKNWTVCQTLKTVNCCFSNGNLTCPPGSGSEHVNFPGYCSILLCKPSILGDRRLYNENRSVWGFIYHDNMYQLVQGTVSGAGWKKCN